MHLFTITNQSRRTVLHEDACGRPGPSQDVGKCEFRAFSDILGFYGNFYTINEARAQYTFLDTTFHNIFDFGSPGQCLYLSHQHRPTGGVLSFFCYRYFNGGPTYTTHSNIEWTVLLMGYFWYKI